MIGDTEIKIVIYADDCSIFFERYRRYENFGTNSGLFFFQVSGLKINKDKTQIMKLGSISQGNVDMNNVTTLGKMVPFVKVLGVYFLWI